MAEKQTNKERLKDITDSIERGMPDSSVSIESMNAYGYTDSDMLPLSKERALELFERDVPVYILYDDNSEGMKDFYLKIV